MNRTQSIISAIVVLIVNLASIWGLSLDANAVSMVVSGAAIMAATIWALWRNHNLTDAALAGQKVVNELKSKES